MINTEDKVIFLHVPKTGGCSVESLLVKNNYNPKYRHLTLGQMKVPEKELDEYTIFTIIRNPWDRVLSNFFYSVGEGRARTWMDGATTFAAYLDNVKKTYESNGGLDKKLSKGSLRHTSVNSIGYWINGYSGPVHELRFETLSQDWNEFKGNIGIQTALPHVNKNTSKSKKSKKQFARSYNSNYRDFYTVSERDLVRELYKGDIEKYGYTF